ncbi:hypothetical protein SAMN05660462_00868 [Proteiniborus ethanoligenes]|uniref:Uncharacterized protein n=1 Tax=Proteiniborus ethanoligenes TaxID=415015 RepID=A0A1H3MNA1_9FIRM|nr:hypothetical protein [Proteiniborus ethanoligenes]SDY77569.1 hypothetical protein SAMN05660462_00868 [Proteiniborus ethanoligenes]
MIKDEQLTLFPLMERAKNVKTKSIPKNVTLKRGQLWCPYCSNVVIFVKDKRLNVKRCPFCGISDNDFWVKKVNEI